MPDLADGESIEVPGSSGNVYELKNVGGVYSCTCPVWRFQRLGLERRTCKHLRALRGEQVERDRTGDASAPSRRASPASPAGQVVQPPVSAGEPKLLLAHRWKNDIDIGGWWMSEKLDGVRAYWTGECFLSRLGNQYLAPDWFLERFPSTPLDGELFCGRGQFQRAVSIVRRHDASDDWKDVRYVVFDAPAEHAPFEDRLATIRDRLVACDSPYIDVHPHERCRDVSHLEVELARLEAMGAEGLMLRQPGSPYQIGRSWTLLKVKSFYDTEGRVVDHIEGSGRHMGRLGALMCELPNGKRFKVGTGFSDAEREQPPAVGSIITFRYQELTNAGIPRFPSFIGERHDGAWPSVDGSGGEQAPRRASPTDGPPPSTRRLPVPPLGAPMPGPRPALVPPPEPPPPDLDPSGNIYLEYLRGASVRFWEVEWDDKTVHVEYGSVDRTPRSQTHIFDSALAARRFVDKQTKAKLEKGYVDEI